MNQSRTSTLWIVTLVSIFSLFVPAWHADRVLHLQDIVLAADNPVGAEVMENKEGPAWEEAAVTVPDPLEPMNRAFFVFNDKLYFWALKPAARAYSTFFPTGVRTCVRNAFTNILFPVRFVNSALQGKMVKLGKETARFVINSTAGVGGFFDIAKTHLNITTSPEDFGQTLGFYGMGPLLYIDLPFLGPSNVRDTFGTAGDSFLNPIAYLAPLWPEYIGIRAGDILNATSLRVGQYEDLKSSALDPYVALRDAYTQMRAKQIKE